MTDHRLPANPDLEAWIRANRAQFTEDALRRRLLEAGYGPAEVDAAFATVEEEAAPPTDATAFGAAGVTPAQPAAGAPSQVGTSNRTRDAWLAFLVALGGILGVPFLLAFAGFATAGLAVGLAAAVAGLVAYANFQGGPRPGLATGVGYALLLILLSPVIAVVGLFGFCLVQGRVN